VNNKLVTVEHSPIASGASPMSQDTSVSYRYAGWLQETYALKNLYALALQLTAPFYGNRLPIYTSAY
jgi:hypothetical protein